MPNTTVPSPKEQLQQWFQWLQAMQNAAETASPVASTLTLSGFTNGTITNILTDGVQVGQFLVALSGKTPYTFNAAQMGQSSTFESLLERTTTMTPIFLFANFLESCVSNPYSTMSFKDLVGSQLSVVFPKGPLDPAWVTFQNGLTSSIPSSCYSATQQSKVKTILLDAASTVQTLLNQLIQLG
jgi:hypothetical protein